MSLEERDKYLYWLLIIASLAVWALALVIILMELIGV